VPLPSCKSVQFVLFLRWLHRCMRDDEIVRAFVRHMAQTIPRIYAALHAIARKQGIEPHEPPLVPLVEFQGHRRND
jgi:hypothetical protein